MRATLQFISYFFLLFLVPVTVFAQTYTIQPGTKSRRVDANGNLTWNYHDMTGWDSNPYQQFHLDDARANTLDMNFRLLPPVGYNPALNPGDPGYKEYPLLVFLHGGGEAGVSWDGRFNYATTDVRYLNNDHNLYHGGTQLLAAVRRNATDPRAFPGFVMVPQARSGWISTDIDLALIIIDKLLETYNIDANKIYVHGLSAGGVATWRTLDRRPDLFAAAVAFSAVPPGGYPYSKIISIPTWAFQGGLDESPTVNQGRAAQRNLTNAGATPRYTEYAQLGHGTWNNGWAEPDFFSWLLGKSKTDIHAKFGKTNFCTDEAIGGTLLMAPGFETYEWRRNGVVINDSTRNELVFNQVGIYTARFLRNGEWSELSKPIDIKVIPSPAAPVVVADGSTALVSLDGRTSVNLIAPDSMMAYRWSNNATTRSIAVTNAGSYTVVVTAPNGCNSATSSPVIVTRGNAIGTPAAPSGVTVTTVSETRLRVNWTDNSSDESGFEVFRSLQEGAGYVFAGVVPANSTSFTDTGLDASTTYFYRTRAINNRGGSAYTAAVSGITSSDLIPPTAPSNLRIVSSSLNSIALAWDPATDNVGVTEYVIFRDGVQVGTSTTTNFMVEGLTHEQSYVFTVKAKDKAGNLSIPSNQVAKQAIAKGLYYEHFLGGTWDSTVALDSWGVSKSGYISNFIIATEPTGVRNEVDVDYFGFKFEGYIYISTAGTYTFYTNSDDGSRLWINDQQIVDNDGLHGSQERSGTVTLGVGAHKIKVVYFDRTGGESLVVSYSGPGVTKRAIPDNVLTSSPIAAPTPPAAPSNLAVTATTSTSITLSWNDNSNNESGFEIFRGTSANGPFTIVSTTTANATTLVDGGLNFATTYFYRLRSIGSTGESAFSNTVSGTTQQAVGAPATPTNLIATAVSKSAISLAWSDNSNNETGFEVYKSTTQNGQYQLVATVTAGTVAYNDINLQAGTSYFYRVKAIAGAVSSEFSNTATATTWPDSPAAPTNLAVGGVTTTSVSLTWVDNSQTETGFRVYRSLTEGGTYALVNTTAVNATSYVDQPLQAGTTYFYRVSAFNASGESAQPSNTVSATTLPLGPETPVLLTATATSTSEIQLTWQDNSTNEIRFVIYRSTGNTNVFVKIDSVGTDVTTYTDTELPGNRQFSYRLKAVNAGGESVFSNTLSATTLNNAPVVSAINNVSIEQGTSATVQFSATDADGDPIMLSATGLPTFATFTNNGNGTGNILFSPGAGSAGTYQITIIASDNVASGNTVFSVMVTDAPVNNAPVLAEIQDVNILEGETFEIQLSATDIDNDPVTISVSGLPSFATFSGGGNGTAMITLNPSLSDAGVYSNIEVRAQDSNGAVTTATFTITIEETASGDPVVIYRINSGYNAISDTPMSWETDSQSSPSPYVDATANSYGGGGTWWDTRIYQNTTGAPSVVFASRRHGATPGQPVRYDFPVANGEYIVNLYFAENSSWYASRRRFNILLEQNNVAAGFNIYEEGGYNAVKKTFNVTVTDGNLDVDLTAVSNEPIISAVEVISLSGNPAARLGGSPELSNMILGVDDELGNSLIQAYPNPMQEKLTIAFNEPVSGTVTIMLVDVLGKTHFLDNRVLMHQDELQVSLGAANLIKGVYLLKLNYNNKEQVIRLLK